MKPRGAYDDTLPSERGGAPGRDQAGPQDASTLPPGGEARAAGVLVERAAADTLPVISRSNYDFGHAIATGGMGRISAARDRRLDRPVAIKELLVHTQALRRRFDREVRISARLQHPAIVNVLEAGQWPGGDPFYAMKLVAGRSLDEVMDVEDGDLQTLSGHEGTAIVQVAFMPGDRELLSSGADGTVRLWPVGHPAEAIWRVDPLNQKKPEIAVRQDGKLMVASGPDGTLWKRALPAGTPERLGQSPRPVKQVVFLHDGAHLLVADAGGELSRWSLADGQRQVIAHDLPYLTRLLVTRDDRHAIGVSFHQSETWVWDLTTGKGDKISSGSGDFRVAFLSPDERYLGIDSALDEMNTGGLYELATGKRIPLAPPMKAITVQGFSPSSRYVFFTLPEGTVTRQDLATGAQVSYPIGRDIINTVLALSDGILLTGSKEDVRVWLPDLGLAVTFDHLHLMTNVLDRSPSGRRVIAQTTDLFFVWDLVTGERHALRGHHGGYAAERWASDDLVVTSTSDGTVRLWPLGAMAPKTPRETLAWLDELTTFKLDDMNRREPDCR